MFSNKRRGSEAARSHGRAKRVFGYACEIVPTFKFDSLLDHVATVGEGGRITCAV
jgi:hypothetical protein